jgi:excisionase family DNA binding protein
MNWKERRFLEVKDLVDPEGPFEGLLGKDLCYKLLDQGKIASVRIGGRRLVLRESVEEFLARLIAEAKSKPPEQPPAADLPRSEIKARRSRRASPLQFRFVPPKD